MVFDLDFTVTTDTFIALTALIFSLVDLYLHIHKERIRFRIRQDSSEPSYNFSFVMFKRYHCAFFRVSIENLSSSPATISRFVLHGPGDLSVPAVEYNLSDHYNKNGISLFDRHDTNKGQMYNLRSENLLNHLRFEPHDSASGYLVFFDVPTITAESQKYTLHTYVGSKHYRTRLIATKLPDDLKPLHE